MPGIQKTMKEFKSGKLHSGSKKGPVVTNPKQAIAIAMNSKKRKPELFTQQSAVDAESRKKAKRIAPMKGIGKAMGGAKKLQSESDMGPMKGYDPNLGQSKPMMKLGNMPTQAKGTTPAMAPLARKIQKKMGRVKSSFRK